jgi:O-acetyl-ADP-ribose deacetylase (regulator of RNase III)
LDFFPVYFPPTHGDLDAARSSIWTEDRAALALQVLDTRGVVQKVFADLNTGLSLSISDFPKSILDDLSGIDSSLSSIRRYLVWKKELKTSLRDLKLACSVMQLFGGSITELIELAKDHASLGQRSDKSIWDDFVSDMIDRHGTDPSSLLKVCRSFFVWLDQIITVEYIELDDIPDMRRKLERYKFWVRDARDGAGTQPHLDEVLYTREFQREATAHTRDTVKLHQIQSIQQLYKLGELEEKPTLAHPSAIFNNAVCLAREDITKLEVDVLVSSTDMTFAGMGTLDRIVFLKGGSELRQAVTAFGTCKEGDVKVTKGYLLPAKHVLHVIPPEQLRKDTKNVLRNIYREVLHTAVAMRATSIAIPSIGKRPGRISEALNQRDSATAWRTGI